MLEFKTQLTSATLSRMYPDEYGFNSDMRARILRNIEYWNFFEGYHWENISDDGERPQITKNYCRKIINKFVAFEFGGGVDIQCEKEASEEHTGKTPVSDYLNLVWNTPKSKNLSFIQIGQTKNITGDAWVQVLYESPKDLKKNDPYGDVIEQFPKGRLRIYVLPPNVVFPVYDDLDKDKLVSLTVGIPVKYSVKGNSNYQVHKEIWTNEEVITKKVGEDEVTIRNPYGVIPFERVGNMILSGDSSGMSDLTDVVPLNTEINAKTSDVSEILDYYASPITVITGAKISNLEKGPNKLWGLPAGASAKNLEIQGNLGASISYIEDLKSTIFELADMPPEQFGGVSNTSGVALKTLNSPALERTRVKRIATEDALKLINRKILKLALHHELLQRPEGYSLSDFYNSKINFHDILPEDPLQQILALKEEMGLGLESRKGALTRLRRTNVEDKIEEINTENRRIQDEEMERQLKLADESNKIALKSQNQAIKSLT